MKFEEEVKSQGKMTGEMGEIFETLNKPNLEKKTEEQKKVLRSTEDWYDLSRDHGSAQVDRSPWYLTLCSTNTIKSQINGLQYRELHLAALILLLILLHLHLLIHILVARERGENGSLDVF